MTTIISIPQEEKVDVKAALARFAAIQVVAAKEHPTIQHGIFGMRPRAVVGLRNICGGWAMDKKGNVYFDPAMVLGAPDSETGEPTPLITLVADFMHEVWHFLRRHPQRFAALPLGEKEKNPKLWNICADAESNGTDFFLRQHLQAWAVFPEKLKNKNTGGFFPKDTYQTAEWFYANVLLPEEGEGPGEGPIGDGPEGGEGDNPADDPRNDCGADGEGRPWELDGEEGLSEGEAEAIRRSVARDIQESARTRGDTPGHWKAWADEELAPPKVPWQQKLHRFLRFSRDLSVGASNYTFSRRSRRQSAVGGDVVLPATYSPKLQVAAVLDTSGSMSDDDLSAACSELDGILRAVNAAVHVISADSRVASSKKITSARQVELLGRGGTDMRVGIRAAAKTQPEPHAIIVLTDGYTPWPDRGEYNIPIVVALIGENCGEDNVPYWFETITVD
mgnify:CR=1 FL=1